MSKIITVTGSSMVPLKQYVDTIDNFYARIEREKPLGRGIMEPRLAFDNLQETLYNNVCFPEYITNLPFQRRLENYERSKVVVLKIPIYTDKSNHVMSGYEVF